jgi:hypothetical protein
MINDLPSSYRMTGFAKHANRSRMRLLTTRRVVAKGDTRHISFAIIRRIVTRPPMLYVGVLSPVSLETAQQCARIRPVAPMLVPICSTLTSKV